MANADRVLLVSGSPRRRELLATIEVLFEVYDADIDETRRPGEEPQDYTIRLAREKAMAGVAVKGHDVPALGADTIVLVDAQVMGKPDSPGHAAQMLRRLSGRRHQVITSVAVMGRDQQLDHRTQCSWVEFGEIPGAWIEQYCQRAEPMDKAGAYAVQGLSAQWIRHIEGSYSGVMGLPLFETSQLLRQAGLSLIGPGD